MRSGKEMVMLVLVAVLLGVVSGSSPASDNQPSQRWWKSMFSGASSSAVVNPIGSSVVFPMYGNVYPIGTDYSILPIQYTQGPHPFYRSSNDLVACRDPLCASLHSSEDYKCDEPERCPYELEYADGASFGLLVKDTLSLNLTNGLRVSHRVAIGCGYNQTPGSSNHPLDGVLGLGKGKTSIVSQLQNQGLVRNVVGHCLSSRGGGFLFFGDDIYDSSQVVWTPMSPDYSHYSPGYAELTIGGKGTGCKNILVLFDSGSSYTYLNSQAYQAFISSLRKELSGKPLREEPNDKTLPLCWKGKKPFKNILDVKKHFKPLALSFSNGWRAKSQFEIPPEAYLIISSKGNVCLGILNGSEVGLENENVIGDISMLDKMVIYDNEKQVMGWVSASCDRPPTSKASFM
ncbi:hypothetical protein RHGRI_029588 [Rhododendron griersonianum]|uniref:Peptidase A1 domain-containing protein n=1 Tax=Rhododendron griersonianum TaxID=479676 RepID=A0AAV6IJX4_9ERIC|nr:hypothetical protein RHGRI_029588 [Rhododendron griersonianum]